MRLILLAAVALAFLPSHADAAPAGCSQPEMRPCVEHQRTALKARHNRRKSDRLSTTGRRTPHLGGPRPRAWCGWWLGRHLGKLDRRLWRAREWATVGKPAAGPAVGTVVVWRHHVGLIVEKSSDDRWIVLSGNDGGAVRQRPRSINAAIAFRWP